MLDLLNQQLLKADASARRPQGLSEKPDPSGPSTVTIVCLNAGVSPAMEMSCSDQETAKSATEAFLALPCVALGVRTRPLAACLSKAAEAILLHGSVLRP